MNITVIYATGRRAQSSTYNLARLLICELLDNGRLFEFQLPKDMPHICMGCYACIRGQEQKCGGSAALAPILAAMEQSELLIFCAPTYVFHVPGQMKTLLDHFAYRWMVHRPDLSFMKKQAVIINTAAGRRHTLNDPRAQGQHRLLGDCPDPYSLPEGVELRLDEPARVLPHIGGSQGPANGPACPAVCGEFDPIFQGKMPVYALSIPT